MSETKPSREAVEADKFAIDSLFTGCIHLSSTHCLECLKLKARAFAAQARAEGERKGAVEARKAAASVLHEEHTAWLKSDIPDEDKKRMLAYTILLAGKIRALPLPGDLGGEKK